MTEQNEQNANGQVSNDEINTAKTKPRRRSTRKTTTKPRNTLKNQLEAAKERITTLENSVQVLAQELQAVELLQDKINRLEQELALVSQRTSEKYQQEKKEKFSLLKRYAKYVNSEKKKKKKKAKKGKNKS